MHISGLLGMPRRVYTYPSGLGWDTYNLISTIGAFILASGLVLLFLNLVVSRFRGRLAGSNPWNAPTLEWQTSSPPPHYNFAVIPKVTSAYPGWDPEDRAEDARKLQRGELVLEEGHETPATTFLDAAFDEIVEMPSESPWPITLALALALVFVMLLTTHYVIAGIFGACVMAALAAWHWQEPQEA
jgi:cytochrome c oxidase subunit 1/cytochrome c oxidase subunit I+III